MSELPEGWTRHLSSSCPGREYFFNPNTGANAWDLQEVLSQDARSRKVNIVSHILSEMESEKSTEANNCNTVSSSHQSEAESEPGQNQSLEASFSSDDSMVFDELDLEEDKNLKSKFKSPKPKTPTSSVEMSDIVKILKKVEESPPESSAAASPLLDDLKFDQPALPDPKKETPRKESSKLFNKLPNPDDFGSKYKNYEEEERLTYESQKEDLPRVPVHGGCSPIESEFRDPSRARNQQVFYHHHQGDRTPEYESPEYCTDDEEEGGTSLYKENISIDLDSLEEEEEEQEEREEENEGGQNETNSVDDYVGFEYEQPPTPPLVKELEEEEECMEVEQLEVEDILQEIQSVRDCASTSTAMEVDDEKSSAEDTGLSQLSSSPGRQVVVLDSSVLLSSLSLVTSLQEWPEVVVLVPWLVLQDLHRLKLSEQKTLGVRARAAVRWVQANLITQPAGQSRQLAEHYEAETVEDIILATCLRHLEDGHQVFLATDDTKLSSKAVLNQLKSGKAGDISDFLEGKPEVEMSSEARENEENELRILLEDSLRKARSITRDILEAVIRKEFRACYGGKLWENMFSIKPAARRPHWSLANLWMLFSTHHVSLLPQFFPTNSQELKTKLQTVRENLHVKKCWRIQDVKEVFQEVAKLIEFFQKKDDYDGMVGLCTEKVLECVDHLDAEELKRNFKKQILEMSSLDQQLTQARVMNLFTSIWEIIHVYTWGFADVLRVSHELVKVERKIQFHSQSEAMEELPRFNSTVGELYLSMQKLLNPEDEGKL